MYLALDEKLGEEGNAHKDMWKSSGPSKEQEIFTANMTEKQMKEMQGTRVVEVWFSLKFQQNILWSGTLSIPMCP